MTVQWAIACLYAAHAVARWGAAMWDFALVLIFMEVWPDSLLLVALHGLTCSLAVATLGVLVGGLVDAWPRRRLVLAALLLQVASVALTAGAVSALLSRPGGGAGFVALVFGVNALAAVAALADVASSVAICRDWVVLLAEEAERQLDAAEGRQLAGRGGEKAGGSPNEAGPMVAPRGGQLAAINAGMRRIDLICRLGAPLVVGLLMTTAAAPGGAAGGRAAALAAIAAITLWNLAAGLAAGWLLSKACALVPGLEGRGSIAAPSPAREGGGGAGEEEEMAAIAGPLKLLRTEGGRRLEGEQAEGGGNEAGGGGEAALNGGPARQVAEREGPLGEGREEEEEEVEERGMDEGGALLEGRAAAERRAATRQPPPPPTGVARGWTVYARQESLPAALSLALLYLTVLSFGALMTAQLSARGGVPPVALGAARGAAALFGVAGTLAYPPLARHLGAARAGQLALALQWGCLLPCVPGALLPGGGGGWGPGLLMGGVVLSRFGLFLFDLSALQIIQESVPEGERGVVGGVQSSIQEFFSMLSYVAGMIVSRPADFWILVIGSFGVVTAAGALYTLSPAQAPRRR